MALDTEKVHDFLRQRREDCHEEAISWFLQFEDYWERKLWHELTDALLEFFELEDSAPQRIPLFEIFIRSFAEKINQLKLVNLGLIAAEQCKGQPFRDMN